MQTMRRDRLSRRPHGLSIVELLVGVVVGLFVVGGAIKLTVDSLVSNRNLLLETRVNQDMRAAADLIARDLRRASYWENAITGLWSAGAPTVSATNPYAGVSAATEAVTYSYQRPEVTAGEMSLGFRRADPTGNLGWIEIQNGTTSTWQAITDVSSINVRAFAITQTTRTVELWSFCSCRTRVPVAPACVDATLQAASTRPRMLIREFTIAIQANSVADAAVRRELRETVRVRNDELLNPNGCPGT